MATAIDSGFRQARIEFRWTFVPWLTITLCSVLWAIHLVASIFGSPQVLREEHGLNFNNVSTYLSHALIHDAGFGHIANNTVTLLLFGALVEVQAGRRWYGPAVVSGMLTGVAGVFALQTATGLSWDERSVGFSAAIHALLVLGVGALVYQWRWGRPICLVTIVWLGAVLIVELRAVRWGEDLWLAAAIVLLLVGISGIGYRVARRDCFFVELTPFFWVFVELSLDLINKGWTYTAAGHLGGLIAGALLLLPVLRGRPPTPATTWTKETLCRSYMRLWDPVNSFSQRRWRQFMTVLVSLLVIVAILFRVSDFSNNWLLQYLLGY